LTRSPASLGRRLPTHLGVVQVLRTFRAGGGPPTRDLAGLAGHGATGSQWQRFDLLGDADGREELDEHQVAVLVGLVVAGVLEDLGRAPALFSAPRVLVGLTPEPHGDEADGAKSSRVGGPSTTPSRATVPEGAVKGRRRRKGQKRGQSEAY